MVETEPPRPRPGWVPWAIGVGVVVVAVAAFFVTKSIASSGGSTPAAATTGNGSSSNGGTATGGANGNGGFQGRLPGTSGAITAIDGTTLTVKDRQNQSVKVTTTGSTRITVEKTVAVSDIAKGDRISVTGTQSGTTIAATRISIMDLRLGSQRRRFQGGSTSGGANANGPPNGFTPPGGANRRPPGGFTFGTVTKVDGSTITISGFNGSATTVTTTPSTTVTKSVQGSLTDLKVGQNVRAVGSTGADGSVAADSINEGTGGFGFFGGFRGGQGTP
jgi:hypothetical protein